jgi:hypothetical protein
MRRRTANVHKRQARQERALGRLRNATPDYDWHSARRGDRAQNLPDVVAAGIAALTAKGIQ